MKYRPEIDGLRAIALIPVILYHAGFELFSGGYVGVDVFFVISGYLITTIILSELKEERFSIIRFYERRARRILPALFFVMIISFVFAWAWFLPKELKAFSKSLVAITLFSSNILFWRDSGYFAAPSEFNPLLHTWSLSVEEQYYVIFPIALLALWRFGRKKIVIVLTITAMLSFSIAQWWSATHPNAAFYLLPSRGWELLIGALVSLYLFSENKKQIEKNTYIQSEISAILGLVLILFSVFLYTKNTPFPSAYALVPTIGTALIIIFGSQKTRIGRFIGNKYFVGIGLISYSAYLWHQPIFVFARIKGITQSNKPELIALSLLSLILAYISWRFIEKPFRSSQYIGQTQIFTYGAFGSTLFLLVGFIGYYNKGYLGQVSQNQKEFLTYFENDLPAWKYFEKNKISEKYRHQCDFYNIEKYRNGNSTNIPKDSISKECYVSTKCSDSLVFIWGDSHAQQLYYGLRKVLPCNYDILQVASSGCCPQINAQENRQDYKEYSNWFAFKKIKELKPRVVIIAQNLSHDIKNMDNISKALIAVGVKKVLFAGPTPHWTQDLPDIVALNLHNTPRRTFQRIDKDVVELDKKIKTEFHPSPDVQYISLIDYFCNNKGCLIYYGDDIKKGITSWDYGHLTPIASYHLALDVFYRHITNETPQR